MMQQFMGYDKCKDLEPKFHLRKHQSRVLDLPTRHDSHVNPSRHRSLLRFEL